MPNSTNFNHIYANILQEVYYHGEEIINQRTGAKVRQIFGVNFKLNPSEDFPLITLRPIPIKAGWLSEIIWFLMGTDNMEFLDNNKNRFWNEFLDKSGNCPFNYGQIWQQNFGRNQMDSLINSLQNEPSSRQNVITIWNGSQDGLDSPKQKNVPCITQFQVSISGGKLYLQTYWRSEDLGLGFVNDLPAFAMLQLFLAQKLNLEVGELIWTIHNAHIYENQFTIVEELIKRNLENNFEPIKLNLSELPSDCLDTCYQQTDLELCQTLLNQIFGVIKPKYQPLSKLARMEIVK